MEYKENMPAIVLGSTAAGAINESRDRMLRFFHFSLSYLNLIASYHGHQRINRSNRPDRAGYHAYIERLQVLYYGSLPSLTKDTSFIVVRITTERLTRFRIYI